MALTPRRAIIGATALSALIALAYLPPSPEAREARGPRFDRRPRTTEFLAARRARMRLDSAASRYLLSRRRDSLLAVVRGRPGDIPFVRFSQDMPPSSREWFRDEVARRWSMLGRVSDAYAVGVSVIIDTAVEFTSFRRNRSVRRVSLDYYLPAALEGRACVTVVRLHRPTGEREGELTWGLRDETRAALFGPCALYAIFGAAGRALTEWIEGPGARFAVSFDSTVRVMPVLEGRDTTLDLSDWGSRRVYRSTELDLPACLAARTERCARILTGSSIRYLFPTAVQVLEGVDTYTYRFRSSDSYLLSDLLAEKGRTAFAEFWQSDEPLEQAFMNAFGEPLDEWAYRWFRSHAPAVPRGWHIPTRSVVVSVVLLVGLVVAGAAHATTRRVTDG